jgi:hypothetical protein
MEGCHAGLQGLSPLLFNTETTTHLLSVLVTELSHLEEVESARSQVCKCSDVPLALGKQKKNDTTTIKPSPYREKPGASLSNATNLLGDPGSQETCSISFCLHNPFHRCGS